MELLSVAEMTCADALAVKAGVDILLFSNTARPRSTIGAEIREILVSEAESDPAFRAPIAPATSR